MRAGSILLWWSMSLMRSQIFALPIALLFAAALPLSAAEAEPAGNQQGVTRQQADAILAELKAIRELLARSGPIAPSLAPVPNAPAVVKAALKIGSAEILGLKDAPVTLVEFTDYQCPFCRQFHTTVFDEIRKKYVDTGKLRFISIDFPLDFHPFAQKAAEASHCAGDQGQFSRMRDILSNNAAKLTLDDLEGYARSLYLDVAAFKSCLATNKYQQLVSENHKKAAEVTVSATPSFLLGKSTKDGVDGVVLVGTMPFDTFDGKLKEWIGQ